MASSNTQRPTTTGQERYFCHRCVRELDTINVDSFTCPYCNQGFLEQLPAGSQIPDVISDDMEFSNVGVDVGEIFRNLRFPMFLPTAAAQFDQSGAPTTSQTSQQANSQEQPSEQPQQQQQQQPSQQQQPQMRPGTGAPASWQNFLQELIESLAGGGGFQLQFQFGGENGQQPMYGFAGQLHGNPGDYAWGPGGLDAIVTRLLNQFEGGPPPLTKEQINQLPRVEITQEQVDKHVQCSVCMEDFKPKENVRRLPCGHHFHNDCIVPWLDRHNTCPVCRKPPVEVPGASSSSTSSGNNTAQSAWDAIEELD